LKPSGWSDEGFVEVVELADHKFYVGVQFHPEFKSKPLNPSPVFTGFIRSILE
jgi:CTP synthase